MFVITAQMIASEQLNKVIGLVHYAIKVYRSFEIS